MTKTKNAPNQKFQKPKLAKTKKCQKMYKKQKMPKTKNAQNQKFQRPKNA